MAGGQEEEEQKLPWQSKLEQEYKKIKEHAETYPYVWGSYILVYGGLGIYTALRWRKLRKTESRVRILQERLRKINESVESASKSTMNGSSGVSIEKFEDKLQK